MQEKIVFLDQDSLRDTIVLPRLEPSCVWESYPTTSTEKEVVERLKDASIALTCSVPLRWQQLEKLPKLEMISLALTGTDIVDLDYCEAHRITVTNVPGYAANTVAEHALAMIFGLFRHVSAFHRLTKRVHMRETAPRNVYLDYSLRDIAGKKLGIIGNGPIAHCLAEKATALGMQVCFSNRGGQYRGPQYVAMDDLISSCNVISINCPLTDETRDLIGSPEIARMKPGAIIVNTARGGIINEAAIIEALKNDRIGGVAIDSTDFEPLEVDDPLFEVIDHDNFILTPHVAWSSDDAMQKLIDCAFANIQSYIENKSKDTKAGL
jgi:glycerate dehydrogenase